MERIGGRKGGRYGGRMRGRKEGMEGSVNGRKDGREEGKYGSMVVRKAKAERKERSQRGWDGRNKKGLSVKRQERNPEVWMSGWK